MGRVTESRADQFSHLVTCNDVDVQIASLGSREADAAIDTDLVTHLAACTACRETALLITPPPLREAIQRLLSTKVLS
jgi:hypothetical protein